LDRYLVSETLRSLAALTLILLLTTVGMFLGDTLADVARGTVPAELLLGQLGLRSLGSLTILVPLALFLAVMLTLGRLDRDSEMVVMTACGVGRADLLWPLGRIVVPGFVLLLGLGMWVSPWADRIARQQVEDATSKISIMGLQPGRFQSIAARDSVVYVESVDPDGRFENAFVHVEREGRKDIVTAKSGFQYVDPASGQRFIALLDGMRTEGVPGAADFRIMHFARNDIRIPARESDATPRLRHESMTLRDLLDDPGPLEWAEIHWRFAPAVSMVAFVVLAVPLSRTRPREGYYGNLVVAILVYIAYANLLALARAWVERGDAPVWIGMTWLPVLALVAGAFLLRPGRRGA
ncbi:MAG: LPS export ABC transporter permease LptF, partial [Pseudomonadota bacterium]